MDYSIYDFLKLLGSLGLFLYGMKIMSEGLQKAAGDKMRGFLSAMTSNRFTGILTGVLITALIQSSSATTVMVVSFVNAGLLSLLQSVGVIMGANIGTTITAWIISVFGFKVNISAFALPMIGLGIPLIFSGKSKRKSWGEFIIGFSLLFMGLTFLKDSVPDLQRNPEALNFLAQFTDMGFLSVLFFLLIGTLLTIVVQSSSATMAITLIMCTKGWISFEIAAAMVLGENIGTTITANLAAMKANVSARRAALAHLTFNVFGVIWMLSLFYPFIGMIKGFILNMGYGDPEALMSFVKTVDPETLSMISSSKKELTDSAMISLREQLQTQQVAVSYALSLFHTCFNICNVLILGWFVKLIVKVVSSVIPQKTTDEEFHLNFISTGLLSTSELSVMQAKKELSCYGQRSVKMFGMVKDLLYEKDNEKFVKLYSRIEKYEQISDRTELEIGNYLTKISEEGELGAEGQTVVRHMMTAVTEIESIDDSLFHLGRNLSRYRESDEEFTPQLLSNIETMFREIDTALAHMNKLLDLNQQITSHELNQAVNIENQINNLRNKLRSNNIVDINARSYSYSTGTFYMDLVNECEKVGDYIINVAEAVSGIRKINTAPRG